MTRSSSAVARTGSSGVILAHFARTLRNARSGQGGVDWATAQEAVRLQLVPAEYAERVPIVVFPFHQSVILTAVLDMPEGYALVREEDLPRWQITRDQLYAKAEENLGAASTQVEAHFMDGPNGGIAVQEMDGYDAVRLLVPGFRDFLVSHLSSPFFAAIPNRDFLMAWAVDCEPAFHQFVRDKAAKDFGERPYPLTSDIFRVDENGVRPWSA